MKKKKLYIHIGTHKAGSTTIQETLEKESSRLAKEGIYYFGRFFGLSRIMREMMEYDVELVNNFKTEVERELKESQSIAPHTYVISNEKFSGHKLFAYKNAPVIAKTLHEVFEPYNFDIKIVVYIRRQDKYLESMYVQKIKSLASYTFDEFLNTIEDIHAYHWDTFLDVFSNVFGKENVIVRGFDKKYLPEKNSLIQNFGSIIGSSYLEKYSKGTVINRGYSRDVLEVARHANKHLDNEQLKVLRKILLEIDLPKEDYSFFSNEERIKLLSNYEASNQRVAREYLQDPSGNLFTKFEPQPGNIASDYTGLTPEVLAVIFSKALLTLRTQILDEIALNREMQFSNRVFRKIKKISSAITSHKKSK